MSSTKAKWWVPTYVPDYEENPRSTIDKDSVCLFIINDLSSKDGEYIPIFSDVESCDQFLRDLVTEYTDLAFALCKFKSLDEIQDKIKEDFNKPIKTIIQGEK